MVWYAIVCVWYGTVWYGVVWYGVVWCGIMWYGIVLQNVVDSISHSFRNSETCLVVEHAFQYIHQYTLKLRSSH